MDEETGASETIAFFKIMFGKDFDKALFLPPKFAESMKDLVDQEIKLEDPSGIWTVTLSYYKKSLAFHKGWLEFLVAKDLKLGDFVTFFQTNEGHFKVYAFGRDGCIKLNASRKNQHVKRAQTGEDIAAEKKPCQATCGGARKRSSSSVRIQPTKTDLISNYQGGNTRQGLMEDEFCLMVDRDAESVHNCHTSVYDLSAFEMEQNNKVNGHEGSADLAQTNVEFQGDKHLAEYNPIEIGDLSMQTAIAKNTDILENNKDIVLIDNMSPECDNIHLDSPCYILPLATAPAAHADNYMKGENISNMRIQPQSPKRTSGNLSQSPQSSCRSLSEPHCFPSYIEKDNIIVKKEEIEITEEASDRGLKRALEPYSEEEEGGSSFTAPEISKVVKTELVDSLDVHWGTATSMSFTGNGCRTIVLPDRLPPFTTKLRESRTAVILEDPEGSEWPGMYQEKYGLFVLHAPWDSMPATKRIRREDHLVISNFSTADDYKYRLNIVGKQLEK